MAAFEALESLHMQHLEQRIFTELSGGERQLVLIARALAQKPGMLIMDEPTASLDFGNQLLVLDHIRELAESGMSVIMSTHLPNHAFFFGTRVLMLKNSRVLSSGTPDETVNRDNMRALYNVDVEYRNNAAPGPAGNPGLCAHSSLYLQRSPEKKLLQEEQ